MKPAAAEERSGGGAVPMAAVAVAVAAAGTITNGINSGFQTGVGIWLRPDFTLFSSKRLGPGRGPIILTYLRFLLVDDRRSCHRNCLRLVFSSGHWHRHVMHRKRAGWSILSNGTALVHHRVFQADRTYHLLDEEDKETVRWPGGMPRC